ncbi:MAG: hypothetical protein NZL90_00805 [Aquificaceae bacterium]|nr:hypothetical protein [Aquificaceae bacterium]MDW8236974.1 hypothetical protein [Aquificaceae bacterium]
MKKLATLDDFLVRDYLIKILGEGEEFVRGFYQDLLAKSQFFSQVLSPERVSKLSEEEALNVLDLVFAVRRKKERVLKETGLEKLRLMIKELLTSESEWDSKVERFARELRGVDFKFARDFASEIIHFSYPDRYVLWTSWIWDPESESGAVVFLKEEPPKRHMYGEKYEEFEKIYKQVQEKLTDFGIKVRGFLMVDIFLAMIYATYVDYMTLSTMHSAKGFFPPAGAMARRLLGLSVKEEMEV